MQTLKNLKLVILLLLICLNILIKLLHTHISNHDLYGIVTEIRENKSITGKLLNGSTNFGGPSLSQMGPYQSSDNIHFMWSDNQT